MYLIVGLGNPGRQYEATRHNRDLIEIDKLVEEYGSQGGVKFNAMYGKGISEGSRLSMKPLSYESQRRSVRDGNIKIDRRQR
ncbi:MAG: hypothetical protein ACLU8Z_04465 [Dorea sp.]